MGLGDVEFGTSDLAQEIIMQRESRIRIITALTAMGIFVSGTAGAAYAAEKAQEHRDGHSELAAVSARTVPLAPWTAQG